MAGEELDPGELGEDPRKRALVTSLVGACAQRAKDRLGFVQAVHPTEDSCELERCAGGEPYRLDVGFELDSALEGNPPLRPAEHRVDHSPEGERLHQYRLLAYSLREGDRHAGVVAGGNEVGAHEEKRLTEPGLELGSNC